MAVTTDRVLDSLARLRCYLDARLHDETAEQREKKRGEPPAIAIALTRQAGSGGAETGRIVAARLAWPVYDHELLDRIAEEKGLSAQLLDQLDERHAGWLEEAVRSFSAPRGGEGAYLKGLLELLASLGKVGHCVIVGRGAAQVLPAETTLRVRLIAPHECRVAAVQKRKGLSKADAEHWVDQTDRERLRFVKYYFHADASDPLLYDLVLNSKRLNAEQCADLIVCAARALEAHLATKAG